MKNAALKCTILCLFSLVSVRERAWFFFYSRDRLSGGSADILRHQQVIGSLEGPRRLLCSIFFAHCFADLLQQSPVFEKDIVLVNHFFCSGHREGLDEKEIVLTFSNRTCSNLMVCVACQHNLKSQTVLIFLINAGEPVEH